MEYQVIAISAGEIIGMVIKMAAVMAAMVVCVGYIIRKM